jgi:hypothetical protein
MIENGDIVQIVDESDPWFPCILFVSEVKEWGVQAGVIIPNSNDGSQKPGTAYRRLKFDKIAKVGKAEFVQS